MPILTLARRQVSFDALCYGVGIWTQRLDHIHIPQLVQASALASQAHMHLVAALVVIVFRMQRRVQVSDD